VSKKRNPFFEAIMAVQYVLSALLILLMVMVFAIIHPIESARAIKAAVWE
jgi:hypothetical protein